ncbi:hypothetical protein [Galbibacter pacificus]|uniref:DUF4168 domain-containing protein n=1 Tax=Galbibacter pacificus TaxID=2996052 RepID=A0ABT6FQI3_9FLAO|nr:hypothetical protein [Galbibacter pacificus]MDG3582002.1 hypothetical protein [Galbibacter pacificus]MDG3585524.1 hypothetical protein [Galbibacter pacificus]
MKKLLFIALIMLQFSVSAQEETAPQNMSYNDMLNKQVEQLQLTGAEKDSFISISKKYYDKAVEVKNSSVSRNEKFQELKSLMKGKDDELQAALSPASYSTYKEMQKENREKVKRAYRHLNAIHE